MIFRSKMAKNEETFFSVEYSTPLEYSRHLEIIITWGQNSMKNIFCFYFMVIRPIFQKIDGHCTPPPRKTPFSRGGGGSDGLARDNSGNVSSGNVFSFFCFSQTWHQSFRCPSWVKVQFTIES